MKVLVAVDDSPYSNHVIDTVLRRHWSPDTQFKIVTVLEAPYVGDDDDDKWKQQLSELQSRRHGHMTKLCSEIRERIESHIAGAKAHFEIREGDPKVEIIDAAIDWSAEHILVGAHGRNICPHFLIGSVSRAIATHAPCSVEIVRAKSSVAKSHGGKSVAHSTSCKK